MRIVRLSALLLTGGLLVSSVSFPVSWIGDAAAALATAVPPAESQPSSIAPKAEAALLAPSVRARRIVLSAPTVVERKRLTEKNAARAANRFPGKSRPLAIGFPRELPATSRSIVLTDLAWQALPDGSQAARIELNSPGAAALRLALALPAAHPDLSLRFQGNAPRATVVGPYPANVIADAALRGGSFWTPILEGDTATIELHAGAGASFAGLALTLGPVSHVVVAAAALQNVERKRESDIGDADSCNIDIACVNPSAALTEAANSVGKLVYSDRAGTTYLCSGTLLNDSTNSSTPYLLTANHCIDDAYVASTLNVYWFFRAQTCGSKDVPAYVLQAGGAMLLARSEDYDWSLVRLNRAPPAGVFFSAWRAEPIPQLAVATGLHHAGGDLAKFSQGSTSGYHVFDDGSSFIKMQWSQGSTETGSSGSGLFTYFDAGGYYEVRGGLFGGDAFCSNRQGVDYYSRLDNMLPLVRQYLTPDATNPRGQTVAVEFYHRGLDHYFISTDANEINLLDIGEIRGWERTGIRFLVYAEATPGTRPVCRFYSRPEVGDSHFFSADPIECARTQERFGASWTYESPSVFYVALPDPMTGACSAGTRPIWRFFNTTTTNHRYTPEVVIRDRLRFDPRWIAEGYGSDEAVMCSPSSND